MKEDLYLISDGVLIRDGNTIYFVNENEKKALPIENISDIYCYGNVTVKSGAAALILKLGIPVHFFNKYGWYEGTLYPRNQLNSGLIVIKQTEHYLNEEKREELAKEFINGIKHNILQTLRYYRKQGKSVEEYIKRIEEEIPDGNIETLRAIEGHIWDIYYQSFPIILNKFEFKKRTRRPPNDEVNSLISFGNSLLYTTTLSEIYNTYLHPSISFVHEPSERRFSLALDIADIFKPIIVERLIFYLINNKMINENHFSLDLGMFLNNTGKKIFINEYNDKLNTTILHPELKRKVSYKYLIRLECYKIIKHLIGDKKYHSIKIWW